MSRQIVYRIIWVPSALILLGMLVGFSRLPMRLPEVGPMKTFASKDGTINGKAPGNWKALRSSIHGLQTEVLFHPTGLVQVALTTDLQGSLSADMINSSNAQAEQAQEMASSIPGVQPPPMPPQKSALERLHEAQGKLLAKSEDYADFKDGATQTCQVAGAGALATDFSFTKPSMWGSQEMIGLRVTSVSGERRLTVVCSCPKEMKATLEPVFEQMIDSIQTGTAGGQ